MAKLLLSPRCVLSVDAHRSHPALYELLGLVGPEHDAGETDADQPMMSVERRGGERLVQERQLDDRNLERDPQRDRGPQQSVREEMRETRWRSERALKREQLWNTSVVNAIVASDDPPAPGMRPLARRRSSATRVTAAITMPTTGCRST